MYIYSSAKDEFSDLKVEGDDIKLDFADCSNWIDIDKKLRDGFGIYTDPGWNGSLNATEEEIADWFFDNPTRSLRIYVGNCGHLEVYDLLSIINILNNCILSSIRGGIASAESVASAAREAELNKVTVVVLLEKPDV